MYAEKDIAAKAKKFYEGIKSSGSSSWESCYIAFGKAFRKRKNGLSVTEKDYLCHHLSIYLNSSEMFRNSCISMMDEKIHEAAVEVILNYGHLRGTTCRDLKDKSNMDSLFELVDKLKMIYLREIDAKHIVLDFGDAFISKVISGTLGCVPTLDDSFMKGIRKFNEQNGTSLGYDLNERSIESLAIFYIQNRFAFDAAVASMKTDAGIYYPEMRFLDIGFSQLGEDSKNYEF